MRPPIEHVRVSTKGKEILIKLKRLTGLQHWNEICRIAFCKSLSIPTPPQKRLSASDSNIDMDWKTFAGRYNTEFIALLTIRANNDGLAISNNEVIANYFRDHLERGLLALSNSKNINTLSMTIFSRPTDN